MDPATLAAVLQGFLAADGNVRKEAEAKFKYAKETDPNSLVIALLQELSTGAVEERRMQTAVALRNVFRTLILGQADNTWTKITPEIKEAFKAQLLHLLESEQAPTVKRSIGDCVADIGGVLYAAGEWPELPKVVGALSSSEINENSTIGLNILTELVPRLSDTISKDIAPLAKLITTRLKEGSAPNKVAAVGTIAKIIFCLDRSAWKPFQGSIPDIMACVTHMVTADPSVASDLLEKLIEMAEADSEIFKPCIGAVLEELIKISRSEQAEEECRRLAVECLLSCVESKPKMCVKVVGFLKTMLATLFECMLSIEHDWEAFDQDGVDNDDEETTRFDIGETGLDRLTAVLGGDVVMPELFPLVGEYLQHPEWQYKFAAIMAISQTVEYLPEDSIEVQLAEIVKMLLLQLQDASPRVRFAACQAIGQLSLDHQPYVQRTMFDQILPPLIATIDDKTARVQAHAITAFINYAEELAVKDLMPHVDLLMEMFLTRLKPEWQAPRDPGDSDILATKRQRLIREQSVTAVAVIAGVIEQQFVKYYAHVVPLTQYIVEHSIAKEWRSLRGKALECLSIIAFSIGYEIFKPDVPATMNALIALIQQDMESDDAVKDYVHEAMRRMVKVLGKDFAEFLPQLLPFIQKTLQYQVEEATEEINEGYTLVSIVKEGQWKQIKTSVVEDLEKSLVLVQTIVEVLGECYAPAVEDTVTRVMPLLNVEFSEAARRSALNTVAELLTAARASNLPQAKIVEWLHAVVAMLFKRVADEDYDVDEMTSDMNGLARCLAAGGPDVLNGEQVYEICKKVLEFMKESAERRHDLAQTKQAPDMDEEDVENVAEEEEREQQFRSTLLDTFSALMKNHPKLFVEVGQQLCIDFIRAHINASAAADRALALFVSTDILEHLGELGKGMWPEFVQRMILSVSESDCAVRQAACYGCMFLAKIPDFSDDVVKEAVRNLNQVVMHPKSQIKDNRAPTDNAIAALMTVVSDRPAVLGSELQDQCNILVTKLPLRADETEGVRVHSNFVRSLQDVNSLYWGKDKENVGLVLKVLGAIYQTDMTVKTTDDEIKTLVNAMGKQAVVAATVGVKLTPSEQRGLDRMFDG